MCRVAAYQARPKEALRDRIEQVRQVLTKAESDFLVFPEGFLTGYHEEKGDAERHAFGIHDPIFSVWLDLFSAFPHTVVVGFTEQDDGALFESALVIENGKLLGIQRKHYRYRPFVEQGTTFHVFTSKGVTFGVLICLDTNYFEPARLLAMQQASIIFAPLCNKVAPSHPYATRPPYYSHFVARSFENRAWIVAADWVYPNDGTLVCPGHSVVYNSDGLEVARAAEFAEEILYYDIPDESLKKEKGLRVHGSPFLQEAILNETIKML